MIQYYYMERVIRLGYQIKNNNTSHIIIRSSSILSNNFQPKIALSTTKSESNTMNDTEKAALYIPWIMDELKIYQYLLTPIKCDNHGVIKIANTQQPT